MGSDGVVALLPMRANSQRVVNKNLRPLASRPLFEWILDSLRGSEIFSRIIVDTDSDLLAAASRSSFPDVEIAMRPKHLGDHRASMNDVISNRLPDIDEEHIFQFHATSPLMSKETLKSVVKYYLDHLAEFDSVFGVDRIQARFWSSSLEPINHQPEKLIPTQDLKPLFLENSAFYGFSRTSFAATGQRIRLNPSMFPVPREESLDIDVEEDFKLAEILMLNREGLHNKI
jgi:CMP-N-acetylneuraminic acid synthetase